MPSNISLDKNGVDVSTVGLVDINTDKPPIRKKKSSIAYKAENKDLNFDPSEVSLYDIPLNKEFVKNISIKKGISQPVATTNIDQLLEFSKTTLDDYSNTSVPIVAPHMAISSFNVPHPHYPNPKVKTNDEKLDHETINRDSVRHYNEYRLKNYVPMGPQEDIDFTNTAYVNTMNKRLSDAKNTYRSSSRPLIVKYNNDEVSNEYEIKPKFENNKLTPFVYPSIRSHMKNYDRKYEQSLKLL